MTAPDDLLTAFEQLMRALETASPGEPALGLVRAELDRHAEPAGAAVHWAGFLREHADRIARGRADALLQFAFAHADDSPVTQAAERWLASAQWERPWLRRTNRPEELPRSGSVPTPATTPEAPAPATEIDPARAVAWLGFDAKADKLVAVDRDGRVRVMETDYGDVLRSVTTGLRGVYAAGLKPDAKMLYVLDEAHSVVEVNLQTRTHLYILESANTRMAAVSPDGQYAAMYMNDGTLHVWDLYETEHMALIEGADLSALRVARDHRVVAVAPDGNVTVYDARHGTVVAAYALGRPVARGEVLFSDGRVLCTSDESHGAACLDLQTGEVLRAAGQHDAPLTDVQFHPDSPFFVTAGRDGALRAWASADGSPMARWESARAVTAAALGSLGRVALGDASGEILLFR